MIEVVDYLPEHLERIKLKACHNGERPNKISGVAVTILSGEDPLAIIGWYFISKGVVQIWAFLSDAITPVKKSFHKEVLSLLRWAFDSHPVQRIQISVVYGYTTGWKWARSLGFSCEGIMKKYGPSGNDYWLFARTTP